MVFHPYALAKTIAALATAATQALGPVSGATTPAGFIPQQVPVPPAFVSEAGTHTMAGREEAAIVPTNTRKQALEAAKRMEEEARKKAEEESKKSTEDVPVPNPQPPEIIGEEIKPEPEPEPIPQGSWVVAEALGEDGKIYSAEIWVEDISDKAAMDAAKEKAIRMAEEKAKKASAKPKPVPQGTWVYAEVRGEDGRTYGASVWVNDSSDEAAMRAAKESAQKSAEEAAKRATNNTVEEEAKKKAEEEAKKKAEEEAKKKAEEEAKKKAEEEAKKKAEEEAKKKAEEEAKKKAEEEAKKKAEEEAKKKAEEEAARKASLETANWGSEAQNKAVQEFLAQHPTDSTWKHNSLSNVSCSMDYAMALRDVAFTDNGLFVRYLSINDPFLVRQYDMVSILGRTAFVLEVLPEQKSIRVTECKSNGKIYNEGVWPIESIFAIYRPFFTSTTTPGADAPKVPEPVSNEELDKLAYKAIAIANSERTAAGLSKVAVDPGLMSIAKLRAKELVTSFSHTRPNGESDAYTGLPDYEWVLCNILVGTDDPETAISIWMNSPGHRRNIMYPGHTAVGAACVLNSNGTPYWCIVYYRDGGMYPNY